MVLPAGLAFSTVHAWKPPSARNSKVPAARPPSGGAELLPHQATFNWLVREEQVDAIMDGMTSPDLMERVDSQLVEAVSDSGWANYPSDVIPTWPMLKEKKIDWLGGVLDELKKRSDFKDHEKFYSSDTLYKTQY